MVVRKVNTINEFNSYLQNPTFKSTVVKFTAQWCGPCRIIQPYFEQLSCSYPSVQFLEVDVDHLPDIMNWAQVRAMPTFTVFKNCIKIQEMVGVDQNELHNLIRKFAF
ncbi:thioredoxin [Brachionus plicatilis]|uniref:Thioredoxin n=1 Tax=Brachionus plicatilis TaxID=10195 RepID=A0A3M7PSF5_BRAPC|nr:thioredoxin [Brachionus plicatilis]